MTLLDRLDALPPWVYLLAALVILTATSATVVGRWLRRARETHTRAVGARPASPYPHIDRAARESLAMLGDYAVAESEHDLRLLMLGDWRKHERERREGRPAA